VGVARARALARVPDRPPGPSEVLEVATFTLALERFAIETRYIARVVRLTEFTPVPGAPEFLGGILNLRGEILDLIDLRSLLGIAGSGLTDLSRIIVLGVDRNEFGIMVDAVQEVITLRVDQVFEAPPSGPGSGRLYLRGVTDDARMILDGAALIRDEGLYIDQGDEPGAGPGS
jgi:purine-binding chemotaxis protein CheW